MAEEKNVEEAQNSSTQMVSDETIKNGEKIVNEFRKNNDWSIWDKVPERGAEP